jgi:hypothetical protein
MESRSKEAKVKGIPLVPDLNLFSSRSLIFHLSVNLGLGMLRFHCVMLEVRTGLGEVG